MKKGKGGRVYKVMSVIFTELCTVVFIVALCIGIFLMDQNMMDLRDITQPVFAASHYFQTMFRTEIDDIINYTSSCSAFETNGKYEEDKKIDVYDYAQNLTAGDGKDEMHTYLLSDLIAWGALENYPYENEVAVNTMITVSDGKAIKHQYLTTPQGERLDMEYELAQEDEIGDAVKEALLTELSMNSGVEASTIQEAYELLCTEYGYHNGAADSGQIIEEAQDTDEEETIAEEEEYDNNNDYSGNSEASTDEDAAESSLIAQQLQMILDCIGYDNYEATTYLDMIDEKALPVSGKGIIDCLREGRITVSQAQEWCENLTETLETLPSRFQNYRRVKNQLETGKSNLYYYYSSPDITRTNMEEDQVDGQSAGAFEKIGGKLGKYMYYNSQTAEVLTNVDYLKESIDTMSSRSEMVSSDFYDTLGKKTVLFVGVDINLPYADIFAQMQVDYNRFHPMILLCLILAAAALVGWIISVICVSASAGHVYGREERVTYWIDRIPVEVMIFLGILLVCGWVAVMFGIGVSYSHENGALLVFTLFSGGSGLAGMGGLLVIYTSLLRRGKAGMLGKWTLVYIVARAVRSMYENRKVTTKVLIWFVAHLVLCFILAFLAFGWEIPFCLFLLVVLCIVEGVFLLRDAIERQKLADGIKKIADGDLEYKLNDVSFNGINGQIAGAVNNIGDGLYNAVEASLKNERLKTDLITNVSHDIKTPLTSIINYVDLIQRENIENEKVQGYLKILAEKSQRLKLLTEDLVEASKVSSGNVKLQFERINFVELIQQTSGEFAEKFEAADLTEISKLPGGAVVIYADGRSLYRVLENLYNNAAKYALAHTRVYVDMVVFDKKAVFSMKNISRQELNIKAEELTERFIRGDISRSTEGSGLGLSIASNLTGLMHGKFEIYLDGDLFKITLSFPLADYAQEFDAGTERGGTDAKDAQQGKDANSAKWWNRAGVLKQKKYREFHLRKGFFRKN